MLADERLSEPTRILAALVATNIVELKVAILRRHESTAHNRIFHDKVGLVRDSRGDTVAFKGSMNETWGGLSEDGNLESVDVFCSWNGGREAERVDEEIRYFDELWRNAYPDLEVRDFPDVAKAELVAAAPSDWTSRLDKLSQRSYDHDAEPDASPSETRRLRPHQLAGLESWRANQRHGVLAFATGAGKTFTALTAISEAIVTHGEVVLVVVPDRLLFSQWDKELSDLGARLNAKILRAGAGNNAWRDILGTWTSELPGRRIVLATLQTARSEDFLGRISPRRSCFIVADEVHNLGAGAARALLDESRFGARLGLSATPERAGDPEGTAAILGFFGRVLEPRYSLQNAIQDQVLTQYFYYPSPVSLSENEAESWRDITRQIVRLRNSPRDDHAGGAERLERLYFERAKIVKQASAKVDLAVDVLTRNYSDGDRWLIYCDDVEQLDSVSAALHEAGITTMPYHSAMTGDRAQTLGWLERYGGVVVAIRCLDEGVDIPAVSHALILASSRNPREFVQRRGRVLRRAEGKHLARIYDAIVVPPARVDAANPDPVTAGELARAIEFASGAENPSADAQLRIIAIDSGLDWATVADAGTEDLHGD